MRVPHKQVPQSVRVCICLLCGFRFASVWERLMSGVFPFSLSAPYKATPINLYQVR